MAKTAKTTTQSKARANKDSTAGRILDVAQGLFAEKGFAETSLRAITSKAGTNLAAVNYHFGSKEALIQAVFQRFLDPFCELMKVRLEALPESASLEDMLGLISQASVEVHKGDTRQLAIFFRLCGLAYAQGQEHLRTFLTGKYGAVYAAFLQRLHQAVPNEPPVELFWRAHFALGAAVFTMSGMESLRGIVKADFGESMSPSDVTRRLTSFLVGGIRSSLQVS